jgi:hypothetical protein
LTAFTSIIVYNKRPPPTLPNPKYNIPTPTPTLNNTHITNNITNNTSNQSTMNCYSASPYPLLDGNNGADTPGAWLFRRKNKKTSPPTNQQSQSTSPNMYEPSIAPSDATTLVPDKNDRKDANIIRPTTPPQGSRSAPWSSYRDLPSGHPVFAYSEEMRDEMYERGIGEWTALVVYPFSWVLLANMIGRNRSRCPSGTGCRQRESGFIRRGWQSERFLEAVGESVEDLCGVLIHS